MTLMFRIGHSIKWFLLVLPMLWSILLVGFYTLCALELGRLPIPSLHDPKIFGLATLHAMIWTGLAVIVYTLPVLVVGLLFFKERLKISVQQAGTYLCGIYTIVYFIVLDPFHILSWFMD